MAGYHRRDYTDKAEWRPGDGDADFGFQHVSGLSFLGEEHIEVTAY